MPTKRRGRRSSARLRTEYAIVGAHLREAREEKNLSQAEVAAKLGVPQSWVSKAETGERRLDVLELFDFLDAVGKKHQPFLRGLRAAAVIRSKD
jgi:transcriptional regulator with XRE-family HTH domain